MNKELLCLDCKHNKSSWLARLVKNQLAFECGLDWVEPKFNPVIGAERKGYFRSCSATRIDPKICGPEATSWTPRDKINLFKLIKHVK
jgi:hypothetical protein